MHTKSLRLRKQIATSFVKELEAFKRGGYQFNGSGKELFEGTQREAFNAYLAGVKSGTMEGYFEIPTGVGKTALFIAIIGCYFRATENIPDAPRILIHEPTTDLVKQTARAFADFMPEIVKIKKTDDDQIQEIDWENSHIDVHHTGRKGAKNDPKILITTYQSQAADERKIDSKKRAIKADDFSFIIHDEAHYLTAPKYGPAAVDKFRVGGGSIQLGVTATPEYSEDKTVANKLGHCYYQLPLNTAIERGDLCHVRPIVLKTTSTTKIDLNKARQFLEQRFGKPFSNAQLEQLLNQEARNQAIIKAYLTGKHPDTEERFLGQTGMIFAGGIAHCDDFTRDAYKVLEKPAYREVKRWLRDEDLCLIAPIHSRIPVDGIELNIGGKKKLCTKDEIKELHRQGKILLIISDQELKLGSDFPMDSFIAETVDRFSVPDATQRLGRGFRVDRSNPRYNYPGNPDKSCAAINVIDETTHEMYKGTPHHPIHTIEILHGAEHRPPGRKKGTISRFKEKPPEVSETLEEMGFEFVTRTEALKTITKKFMENKKKDDRLPDAKNHWIPVTLLRGCMAVKTDTKPHNLILLRDACGRMLDKPKQTWSLPRDEVSKKGDYKTPEVMGRYTVYGENNIYFDPRMVPFIRQEMGLPVLLPDDKKHWIAAAFSGCSKIKMERTSTNADALYSVCKAFASQKMIGKYPTDKVVGLFTNKGQPQTYYFDPCLIEKGLITKQMVKDEAARIKDKESFKSQRIVKKDITPGGDALKRRGHSRGES